MAPEVAVVVALKHPLVALGVHSVLASRDDIRVLEECATLAGTVRALKRHQPRVLIAGTEICDGRPGALEPLTQASPDTRVALLCMNAGEFAEHTLFEGARAILPPETAPEQLVECIHALAAGKRWRAPLRMHGYRPPDRSLPALVNRAPLSVLSARERQIAEGVASGKRNREIAEALGIAPGTVKLHVSRVFAKLGVKSRVALLKKMMTAEQEREA